MTHPLKARAATRRCLIQAVAVSLLLHLVVIGAASRFAPPPAERGEDFTITLDILKARPRMRPPAPPKPRVARLNPPRRPNRRQQRPTAPLRRLPNLKNRQARLNPVPDSDSPRLNLHKPSENRPQPAPRLNRRSRSDDRRSRADEAILPQSGMATPRSGRAARNRKSDAMQLTLNPGSNFHLDNSNQGPSSPTPPSGAGIGSARRGSDATANDSNLAATNPSGRMAAAFPHSGSARRAVNNAPDTADASDEPKPDESSRPGSSRRSGRRRDENERENSAPLPTPPASGFPTPEPTPAPRPTSTPAPKPVEFRERPEPKAPDVFRRARPRFTPSPDYPAEENHEGKTTLRLSINAKGDVVEAEIVTRSGSPVLDAKGARDVKRYWKYYPAQRGETAVASSVNAIVHWRVGN